jgi:hypothetical protein
MFGQLRYVHKVLIVIFNKLESASNTKTQIKIHASAAGVGFDQTPGGNCEEFIKDTNLRRRTAYLGNESQLSNRREMTVVWYSISCKSRP